jgi:hypothetical protein
MTAPRIPCHPPTPKAPRQAYGREPRAQSSPAKLKEYRYCRPHPAELKTWPGNAQHALAVSIADYASDRMASCVAAQLLENWPLAIGRHAQPFPRLCIEQKPPNCNSPCRAPESCYSHRDLTYQVVRNRKKGATGWANPLVPHSAHSMARKHVGLQADAPPLNGAWFSFFAGLKRTQGDG